MEISFNKTEIDKFSITVLEKMLNIQILSEKFEGAALIRDIIKNRITMVNGDEPNDSDDSSELI